MRRPAVAAARDRRAGAQCVNGGKARAPVTGEEVGRP